MKATKQEIRMWLEMQIGIMYAQKQKLTLTEKIGYPLDDEAEGKIVPDVVLRNISSTDHIHLDSKSLRFVSKELELPVAIVERGTKDYPYELQFYYNGVQFMSLESEDEYKANGELA